MSTLRKRVLGLSSGQPILLALFDKAWVDGLPRDISSRRVTGGSSASLTERWVANCSEAVAESARLCRRRQGRYEPWGNRPVSRPRPGQAVDG